MALTPEQVHDFPEKGFSSLGTLFEGAELAELRAAYDRCIATPISTSERRFDAKALIEFAKHRV